MEILADLSHEASFLAPPDLGPLVNCTQLARKAARGAGANHASRTPHAPVHSPPHSPHVQPRRAAHSPATRGGTGVAVVTAAQLQAEELARARLPCPYFTPDRLSQKGLSSERERSCAKRESERAMLRSLCDVVSCRAGGSAVARALVTGARRCGRRGAWRGSCACCDNSAAGAVLATGASSVCARTAASRASRGSGRVGLAVSRSRR